MTDLAPGDNPGLPTASRRVCCAVPPPPTWRRATREATTTLEVLYFDGCPSHEQLLPTLRDLAAVYGLELTARRIDSAEQAQQARFLGSPSVRVNGIDIEPDAHHRTDFGLNCRLYRSPDGHTGLPPRQWIERALQDAGTR